MFRHDFVLVQLILAAAVAFIVPSVASASQVKLLVARTTIYPGQAIHADSLRWRSWRGTKQRLRGYLMELNGVVGKVARRTLVAGRPIAHTDLRVPNLITQGQVVSIIFRSGAIQIVGRAVAMQAGAGGSMIRVRNVDSRRIIIGVVQNDGSVLVGAPR
ncbi:MAG: flagellar basal body P-ring formation chaperone FlgA [Pseudomonadota bacterium]